MSNYDVIVIGGGGAGLTAALYTARGELKTALFEKLTPGGQIASTDEVENYPGFPEGITGMEISAKMEEQAKKYGAVIIPQEVTGMVKNGEGDFTVLCGGERFAAKTVIVASGANARKLSVPGEKEFAARGVSYCATCDGAFFRNKEIAVVGGGDSAIQEALFLTKFASKVTVIHRRDALRASKILQERAFNHEKIVFAWNAVIKEIQGEKVVTGVVLTDTKTGQERTVPLQGVFIFIGHDPVSSFVQDVLQCDDHGYIITTDLVKTSLTGVFACGEVRQNATRQLVSTCGEGCTAALAAQAYIDDLN